MIVRDLLFRPVFWNDPEHMVSGEYVVVGPDDGDIPVELDTKLLIQADGYQREVLRSEVELFYDKTYNSLQELCRTYNQQALREFEELDLFGKMSRIHNWALYENAYELDECRNLGELEEMYKFITMGIGVEFVAGIREQVEEEGMNDEYYAEDAVKRFNEIMGHQIISL